MRADFALLTEAQYQKRLKQRQKEMEKQKKLDKLRGISEDLPEDEQRMLLEANNSRSTLKSSIKGETVDKDDLEILL